MATEKTIDRRAFMGWAASGAAGLLLPTVARAAPRVFDLGRQRGFYRPDPAIAAAQQNGIFTSVRDGDWDDPQTWGGSLVPCGHVHVFLRHIVLDQFDPRSRVAVNFAIGCGWIWYESKPLTLDGPTWRPR